jgi:1-phosphofructokinase/tagatose 6-phosphate kinase
MITVIALNPAVDKTFFIDGFEAGRHYRVRKNIVKSAGGKGINVSRVASILGEKVTAVGFKAGETGRWLESELQTMGADVKFIPVEGESRTTINIIDKSSNLETEVIEPGPFVNEHDLDRFMDIYKKLLQNTKILICTGGLPEGVPSDIYRVLIEMAKPFGIITILDAANDVLSEGIKAKPHLVKPNLRELLDYTGKELNGIDDIMNSCRHIVAEGVRTTVASLGGDGALLAENDLCLYSRAPVVEAVNTIGCGDSMIAGFAVGFRRGYTMEESLKLAMACAVSNTQFMEVGLVSMEMVGKYMEEISIEKLFGKIE